MRRRIKTLLLRSLGEGPTAYLQALHFVRLLRTGRYFDPDYEYYEPELALLPRLLRPGDVAVDVGALGANWTYAMHRAVTPGGQVFAFEAHPFHARATAVAMKLMNLRGARLFPFGLSNEREEVQLRVRNDRGESFEGQSAIATGASAADAGCVTIHLETLDGLVALHPRLADTRLLKIDVEGYELFVLQGAGELIRRARPIVIVEKGAYEEQGYTSGDVHDFFAALDYRAFVCVGREAVAATDAALEHPAAASPNRILVPVERLGELEDVVRP